MIILPAGPAGSLQAGPVEPAKATVVRSEEGNVAKGLDAWLTSRQSASESSC